MGIETGLLKCRVIIKCTFQRSNSENAALEFQTL